MTSAYRKACVTGGAGFIGAHLVRRLLDRGVEVHVIDNLSTGRRDRVPEAARLFEADILDTDRINEAIEGCDIVFHLAARVAIRSSFEFVVADTQSNVVGTASVLRAVQICETCRKVVAASSMAVYADAPSAKPIDEEHATLPVSPYGISKLALEQLTHTVCAQSGRQSVVLRLFNTYGPGQELSPYVGVVTIFVNKLLKGQTPTIYGDGEQCRDFVHVNDVVSGLLAAMDADVTGETFNIGTGIDTSVNSVLRHVNQAMKTDVEGRHEPAVLGELRFSVADIRKAAQTIGYQPAHRFDQSVDEVVTEIIATTSKGR